MLKIINGKRYNPTTAKKLCYWDNGYYNDFRVVEETLYRKITGEFFIYAYGRSMTQYAQSEGNTTYGSESIKPISLEQAKIWLEGKTDADTRISKFLDLSRNNTPSINHTGTLKWVPAYKKTYFKEYSMKQIIAGKLYDINTATKKAEWDNDCLYGDAHFISETLYQKVNNMYFLHRIAGALTKYADKYGNNRSDSSNIIPLSDSEVEAWIAEKKASDCYLRFITNKYGRKSILRLLEKISFHNRRKIKILGGNANEEKSITKALF